MGGVVLVPFMSAVEVILMLSSLLGQGFYNRAATTILLKKKETKNWKDTIFIDELKFNIHLLKNN